MGDGSDGCVWGGNVSMYTFGDFSFLLSSALYMYLAYMLSFLESVHHSKIHRTFSVLIDTTLSMKITQVVTWINFLYLNIYTIHGLKQGFPKLLWRTQVWKKCLVVKVIWKILVSMVNHLWNYISYYEFSWGQRVHVIHFIHLVARTVFGV